MAKMTGKGLALFMLDSNLMTMRTLVCEAESIELDQELKALIYAAIRKELGKRVLARFHVEQNEPQKVDENQEVLPFIAADAEQQETQPVENDGFSESPEERSKRVEARVAKQRKT